MSATRPFDYNRNKEAAHTDEQSPCVCCGRAVPTAKARFSVHVVAGGAAYGGEQDTHDNGDMGWFDVGASCARRLRAAGVYVAERSL